MLCLVAQSRLTPCIPMNCSPPGSSVHGDSPGNNTGVDCHFLLQGIFPTQGWKPRSSTLRADSLTTEPPGKPRRSLALLISSGKSGLLWFLDIRLGPHDSLWPMAHEERWGTQHPSRGFRSHYVVCLFPPPGPPKEEQTRAGLHSTLSCCRLWAERRPLWV